MWDIFNSKKEEYSQKRGILFFSLFSIGGLHGCILGIEYGRNPFHFMVFGGGGPKALIC